MKETSCDLTDMISLLSFLCSEFKFENIYSGVNFNGKMFAVTYICGSLEKLQRLEHKNFVPHGMGPKKTKIIDTNIRSKNTI